MDDYFKPDMRDKFKYGLGCLRYGNCFSCPFRDCTYEDTQPGIYRENIPFQIEMKLDWQVKK